jgi:hypothetical protein
MALLSTVVVSRQFDLSIVGIGLLLAISHRLRCVTAATLGRSRPMFLT